MIKAYDIDRDIVLSRMKYRQIKPNKPLAEAPRYVKNEYIMFEKRILIERFSIQLPTSFSQLLDYEYKQVFIMKKKPEVALSNSNRSQFLCFQCFPKLSESILSESTLLNKRINRLYPETVFYDQGNEKTESGRPVLWFEYKSFSLQNERYNFIFLFHDREQSTVMGKFICSFPDYIYWKPSLIDMIKTINEFSEKGNENA